MSRTPLEIARRDYSMKTCYREVTMKKQGNVTSGTYVRTLSNAQVDKMNKQELIHAYCVLRNAHFETCKDKDNDIRELEQQLVWCS